MLRTFSRHAQRRMQQRNISSGRARAALAGGKTKYLGRHKFKSSKLIDGRTVTVIYKKSNNRKIAVTAWKK